MRRVSTVYGRPCRLLRPCPQFRGRRCACALKRRRRSRGGERERGKYTCPGDRLREPNWRLTLYTTRSMLSNNAKHLLSYYLAVIEHLRDALKKCQPANKLLDRF